VLSALLVLLAGCSSLRKTVDPGIVLEQCTFERESAHYYEVLDELGPPARLSAISGGFVFIYETLVFNEQQLGLSGQKGWLQLLKMSFAGTDLRRSSYLLRFDSDGMLLAAGTLKSKEDLGVGGSMQALFAIKQIVDTSAYEDDAFDSIGWGASLLDPLPSTLNSAQNLNTGRAGVEQSGTTTVIGQHTLEMR
jgi:hypothetical protein